MLNNLFKILLICACLHTTICWKFLKRGKSKYGSIGAPNTKIKEASSEQWFRQELNHFDQLEERTWLQRYFTNDLFYTPGGPVFLMIGGEGEATAHWMVDGAWVRYGKKYNALLFQLEHRFYGKSYPTEDLSIKNLQYLSSEQALADIANFITQKNDEMDLPLGTKWITFGGSYPGALSAWARLKYPHLIHGAVSSSGPLLALIDFKDFFRVVEDSLKSSSQQCVDNIKSANHQLISLLKDPSGPETVYNLFKLCNALNVTNKNDMANLYSTVAGYFAEIVQYNKDNRIDGKSKKVTIDTVCNIMGDATLGEELNRLAKVVTVSLSLSDDRCVEFKYQDMIDELKDVTWQDPSAAMRQWFYQTCTEFGFFQTSTLNSTQEMFGLGDTFSADFYIQQCIDVFGPKFQNKYLQRVTRDTNTNYGEYNIQASNVVFVHGSIDPWHALGITHTLRDDAPAIFISGTAHCANMYPSSPKDPPQLIAARNQIESLIGKWLAQGEHTDL